jgi:hypothetical protein
MTSPEETLRVWGFRPGDVITRNVWGTGLVLAVLALTGVVVLMAPWIEDAESFVSFLIFLGLAALLYAAPLAWHRSRPRVVFEADGLRVGEVFYGWSQVTSLHIAAGGLCIDVPRLAAGAARRP